MRVIGQERVADLFGVAPKTIVEWQEAGFPVALRGKPGVPSEYESADCIAWMVERELGKIRQESPRDRLFRLQAENLEVDLAEKRKHLIPVAAVEPKWRAACLAAREALLRDRRRLAARLDGVVDRQERERLIGESHEEFLRKLSEWQSAGAEEEAETT
jgi:terminase small subunit / prophage DNA-packing protein